MESVIVSGVSRATCDATFGKSSRIACVNNGAVMMNITSKTSMTSINGVMLISAMGAPFDFLSSPPNAMMYSSGCRVLKGLGGSEGLEERALNHTILDRSALNAARRHAVRVGVQVVGESVEFFRNLPHHAPQHVVRKHRRNGDDQPERRHDERLAHRTRHVLDHRLTARGNAAQRVIDAPHGAQQADERRCAPQ